jgi:hypothetical protein
MRERNQAASEEGAIEIRQQDEKFCRRLQAAIDRGLEFCPTVANTVPAIKRPTRLD